MKGGILFVLFCVKIILAQDNFEDSTTNIALNVYGDCSNSEDIYICLKKKAVTLLDRLGRSQNFTISDSVKLVSSEEAPVQEEEINEKKLDEILPRSLDDKNAALTTMLSNKIADFFGSRTIEISLPRSFTEDNEIETEEGNILSSEVKKSTTNKNMVIYIECVISF